MYQFFRISIILVLILTDIIYAHIKCGVKYVNTDKKDVQSGAVNLKEGEREKWTNGIVYYQFDDKLNATVIGTIEQAMEEIRNNTVGDVRDFCIKFQEINEKNHVRISEKDGCYVDFIGKNVKGSQNLYLHPNCWDKATIKHLLIHVLGFDHEQNRPDRDDYIEIFNERIEDEGKKYFEKVPDINYIDYGTPYDYNSIMHLSDELFTKSNQNKTMIGKNNNTIKPSDNLTLYDIREIHLLYECSSSLEKRDIIWNASIGSNCELPGKIIKIVNTSSALICENRCRKSTECTHFIWNPNNDGTKVYSQDEDDDVDFESEDDKSITSSFGYNGSCIMKTGRVAKSDAKYYQGFNQSQLFCGIIKPIETRNLNNDFEEIFGRKFPPDLGFYRTIEATNKVCKNECNKDGNKCIMFTFYTKVHTGKPFCRLYNNSVEIFINNGTDGVVTYKRRLSIAYAPGSDSPKQFGTNRVFTYFIAIFLLKFFF